MKKNPNDLSELRKKITYKGGKDKFKQADQALGIPEEDIREKVVRKSYTVTQNDLTNIRTIKEKCLTKKVILNASWIIRMSLYLASKLSEEELIKASNEIPNIPIGRQKIVDKN